MADEARPVGALRVPAEWGFGHAVEESSFDGWSEESLLEEMHTHQRMVAWLAERDVAITRALTKGRRQAALAEFDLEQPDASARERALVAAEACAGVEDEIALAAGVSGAAVHARVELAVGEVERSEPVRAALASGDLSWGRAMQVWARTAAVPAERIGAVVERLVAPYPARSASGRGGLLVPQSVFLSRLRYQVARYSTAENRHEVAMADRRAFAVLDPEDGTGRLQVIGHAGRIAGAYERVDGIARRLRGQGDARTLAQLRSDVAVDLLLYARMPESSEVLEAQDRARLAGYSCFGGELPPARVDVVVSLASLMGATDEPGLVRHGTGEEYLPAEYVRDLAFAAGSTWRRLVTDPVTGYLADLATTRYEVTGHLRERIVARDRISRAPGSAIPAARCDMDHDVDFHDGGASSESNVSAKHRRGHNHKTRRTWRARRSPGVNGSIFWTTPTGRVYETRPWDYRDPDPVTVAQMRANVERAALDTVRWATGPDSDAPAVAVGGLGAGGEPLPDGVPAGAVEIVSTVEKGLIGLLEDHLHEPPERRGPRTRSRRRPRPPQAQGWGGADPGPPPF